MDWPTYLTKGVPVPVPVPAPVLIMGHCSHPSTMHMQDPAIQILECESSSDEDSDHIIDDDPAINSPQKRVFDRLEHALAMFGLTPFSRKIAVEFIKRVYRTKEQSDFQHVTSYLLSHINGRIRPEKFISPSAGNTRMVRNWQYGCPDIIPGLTAKPVWYGGATGLSRDTCKSTFPWLEQLETHFHIIKKEFLTSRHCESPLFQPYRSPKDSTTESGVDDSTNDLPSGRSATDSGSWHVCYLYLHGLDFTENIDKFPQTNAILRSIPRFYNHAFFSALSPLAHVESHYGPTNKKLRCHFPIVVPLGSEDDGEEGGTGEAWLRVGEERVCLKEGKAVIFDDSFEHEAGNQNSSQPRVVLIMDVWHPDLTEEEIKFLQFVSKAQMTAAKRLNASKEDQTSQQNEDFYSLIMEARRAAIKVPDEAIWGSRVVDD